MKYMQLTIYPMALKKTVEVTYHCITIEYNVLHQSESYI